MNDTTLSQQYQLILSEGIISDIALEYLGLALKIILNPLLGLWGLCANVVNVMVFSKMATSDGVTQNFLILSVSDGLISIVSLTSSASHVLQVTLFKHVKYANELCQSIYWASVLAVTFPQNVSIGTTVVVAVVRCCCVAMPFKVKRILTARRQLCVILSLAGLSTCVLTYSFSSSRLVHFDNPGSNISITVYDGYDLSTYTIFTGVFLYSSFTIFVACVVVLIVSLRRASQFRKIASLGAQNSTVSVTDGRPKERTREMQAVRVVILVAGIFIVCNIPIILFAVLMQYVEEFSSQGIYRNSTLVFLMLNETFLVLNVDLNIVIYFLYNMRYRETFKKLLMGDHRYEN